MPSARLLSLRGKALFCFSKDPALSVDNEIPEALVCVVCIKERLFFVADTFSVLQKANEKLFFLLRKVTEYF